MFIIKLWLAMTTLAWASFGHATPYNEAFDDSGAPRPAYVAPGAPVAHVDVRPIAYVGPSDVTISRFPFARGATRFGNGRHNVSQGALQVVVLTPCKWSFLGSLHAR